VYNNMNLERHGMIGEPGLAEDELGSFVGKLEEDVDLVAEVAEEVVAGFPANDEHSKHELQPQTPQHRPPSHLSHTKMPSV